ncbi:MAG: iron ABC transporter substrate-binding protein [Ruminococcaceae bacterium]|nr:iron ABC transporter substrate-binding protein [Oscillospiraceae bacterium]
MKAKKLLALLLAALFFAGCSGSEESPTPAEGRSITDALGREVTIPETVESVVCVGVGALRYTSYLGGQDRVIGVEDYEKEATVDRLYNLVNFEHFSALPAIGGNGEPWHEEIINVYPQLIVLSAIAGVDADDLQQKTGIPVVTVAGSDSLLDGKAYETLALLGEIFGMEERAGELTEYLKNSEKELMERGSRGETLRAYVGGVAFKGYHGLEWTEAGYGPLALIGAENLADSLGRSGSFELDREQILAWDPDVIFVDYTGLPLVREDYAARPELYESLTAVKEGRVYSQIPFRSFAVNLDTALADAWYAGCVLCPEGFSDIDPEAKAREIFTMLLGSDPYDQLKEAGYGFTTLSLES